MKRRVKLLIAAGLVAGFAVALNYSFGADCDGDHKVNLVLSASQAAQIAEIRYCPLQSAEGWLRKPERQPDGSFICGIPYSYDLRGIIFPYKTCTAPPATAFTVWVRFSDGSTHAQRQPLRTSTGEWLDVVHLDDDKWTDAPPLTES